MKSDLPYLKHIIESISAIESYVRGGRDVFMKERLIQDAVIRNLEIIGEAARQLSPAVRNLSSVDWGKIIAFRNRLIHGYWSVDLLLVWDVVVNHLPRLKTEVARLLIDPSEPGGASPP